MKFIIFIICTTILQTISVKQNKPKLCINCKYFMPNNDNSEFSKCSLFPKEEGKINFLVNGINVDEYYYCSTSRISDSKCGEEGKYYKKKIGKKDMYNKNETSEKGIK